MSARAGRPRKTAETPVKAVEEVKENVKEDVKEAVEAVKTAVDEVKEEIRTEVKEEVKKTPARRGRKPAAEKVAEKVESVTVKKNVVLQFEFGEYVSEEIVENCIKAYQAENRAKVKSIDVYVKPADMKAYYVVNGKSAGSVDL
ncbi:putative uncharacterized protein [Roseburia sp. CAG:303]|nr:putative uncharacterized protein [Roseburia sp. CAG:303]